MTACNVTEDHFLFKLKNEYITFLEKESVFDESVDKWFLMPSVLPIMWIIVAYLLFIVKIGPAFMKNREPFNLKYIIMLYNIVQVLYNGFIVFLVLFTPNALYQLWNHSCYPIERSQNLEMIHELNKGAWYFFISKVIDLLDTVFFVLRKKQSQVTFLHIYHHVNMVITTWVYLRFVKDEQAVIPAEMNAVVHMVMYSYYFLSAMGPQMQPYLWWKKYLTKLQIIQFLLIIGWYIGLVFLKCQISKLFSYYLVLDVFVFIYLFIRFYMKTYAEKTERKIRTE